MVDTNVAMVDMNDSGSKFFPVLFINLILYYTVKLDLSCSSCNFTEGNNLTSADVTKCIKTHSPMSPCEKTLGMRLSCCRFYVGRVSSVVVQFYPWFKFYFLLFWGTVMYGKELKTKGIKI